MNEEGRLMNGDWWMSLRPSILKEYG